MDFVLLGTESCSGLQLAYSADLFRAVLVDSWLMTHFTASGGYRINLQINYRSSAGRGLRVGVGVGASWRATRDPGPESLIRASVSSVNGASGDNSNNVKQSYLPNL